MPFLGGNQNKPETGKAEKVDTFPIFADWKGEIAQEELRIMWEVSGHDKDFILTMAAENGSFDPYLKHPKKNRDGTRDYSFGLNSAYHWPMIQRILNKEASLTEIAEYHWGIYNEKGVTSCGVKKFCGYNRRDTKQVKAIILFP